MVSIMGSGNRQEYRSLTDPKLLNSACAAFISARQAGYPLSTSSIRKDTRTTSLFARNPDSGPAIDTSNPKLSPTKRSDLSLDPALYLPQDNDENFYGRFITLGYHKTSGPLYHPLYHRSERNKTFELWKRVKPNGWTFNIDARSGRQATTVLTPAIREQLRTMSLNTPVHERLSSSIRVTSVERPNQVIEYTLTPSLEHDLFQFGRDTYNNDFYIPGHTIEGHSWDPVSRLAFRVQCNRNDPTDTKISAAGFDFANELFLGPHALRWSTEAEGGAPGGADGGITVGLFLWKPSPNLAEEPNPPVSGNWYEVSALGELYHLRISGKRGPKALNIDNTLTDGCIVVNANSVLLFRTIPPSKETDYLTPTLLSDRLDKMKHALCPITYEHIPLRNAMISNARRIPFPLTPPLAADPSDEPLPDPSHPRAGVFPACGHVFELLPSHLKDRLTSCPQCRRPGHMIPLLLQTAPTMLAVDAEFTHVLPCGHAVSEELGRRMAGVPLPTNDLLSGETEAKDWVSCLSGRRRRCWFCGEGFYVTELRRLYFEMEEVHEEKGNAEQKGDGI